MFKASTGETGSLSLGAFLKQTIEWLSKQIKGLALVPEQLLMQGCLLEKQRGHSLPEALAESKPPGVLSAGAIHLNESEERILN